MNAGHSLPISISPTAIALAHTLHDTFERRALDEMGYPPRPWAALTVAEQKIRAEAAQELIENEIILVMPSCPHPFAAQELVRREMRICHACGVPVSLLRSISKGVI